MKSLEIRRDWGKIRSVFLSRGVGFTIDVHGRGEGVVPLPAAEIPGEEEGWLVGRRGMAEEIGIGIGGGVLVREEGALAEALGSEGVVHKETLSELIFLLLKREDMRIETKMIGNGTLVFLSLSSFSTRYSAMLRRIKATTTRPIPMKA